MEALVLTIVLAAADPEDGLGKKLLPIYVKEAETYSLAIESAPKKVLELKKEPVFEWVNPTRNTQQGVVFVWLRDGRPAALACIFSQPYHRLPGRLFIHELHALDSEQLLVTRTKGLTNEWKPKTGLQRKKLTDAPVPADTPVSRLVQMKNLAAEFTGHAVDGEKKSWELRLLPKPLYRYPVAKTGVIDGALFALVSDAGTDPEVLLLVEAREVAGKTRWDYACGRFSDGTLHVKRKDKEVFASVLDETNTLNHGPQHLYRLYLEKVVNSDGKLLAWMRPKPNAPWGEPSRSKTSNRSLERTDDGIPFFDGRTIRGRPGRRPVKEDAAHLSQGGRGVLVVDRARSEAGNRAQEGTGLRVAEPGP